MDKCLRCGKCCVPNNEVCRFLLNNLCTIYNKRIGTDIGNGYVCDLRSKTKYDFPECPYNTNKKIHPNYDI